MKKSKPMAIQIGAGSAPIINNNNDNGMKTNQKPQPHIPIINPASFDDNITTPPHLVQMWTFFNLRWRSSSFSSGESCCLTSSAGDFVSSLFFKPDGPLLLPLPCLELSPVWRTGSAHRPTQTNRSSLCFRAGCRPGSIP